jgi:hypothetical protein
MHWRQGAVAPDVAEKSAVTGAFGESGVTGGAVGSAGGAAGVGECSTGACGSDARTFQFCLQGERVGFGQFTGQCHLAAGHHLGRGGTVQPEAPCQYAGGGVRITPGGYLATEYEPE